MISSLKVCSGFAEKLLKRKISFSDGLNVLFGPNGCGKTTALNIIAAHCSIDYRDGGWSKVRPGTDPFKDRVTEMTVEKCKADVNWDGTPTLYSKATVLQSAYFDWDNPLMSVADQIVGIKSASDGEFKIMTLANAIKQMRSAPGPDHLLERPKGLSGVSDERMSGFFDHIKSLSRDGKLTVLLDEPDRSLSIPNQSLIWARMAEVTALFQVIVASHSPFALASGAKIINLGGKGHVEDCRRDLRAMAKRL